VKSAADGNCGRTVKTVTWLLFESQVALAATFFPVLFGLLVYWRRSGRGRPLLVALIAAGTLFGLQEIVVTRCEQAIRVLSEIEKDVVSAQTARLAAALAPEFRAGKMDRDEFVEFVQHQYRRVRVEEVSRGKVEVLHSSKREFVVRANYRAEVMTEWFRGLVTSQWQITFVQTEEGWRIKAAEPLHIGGVERPGWSHFSEP